MVGRGGMGVVYRAQHMATGAIAALKTVGVPRERTIASFRREIRALRLTRHPGVVPIREDGVEGGIPWYAMDLLEGPTLREPMEGSGRTAEGRTGFLSIIRRLASTLSFLHGRGLVHRDLKPENVIVDTHDRPTIVDFGLAVRFGGWAGRERMEMADMMSGSAAYMAPEQIRGDFADARADLYSLGCILYEWLAGHPPFCAGHAGPGRLQRLTLQPPPPSIALDNRNAQARTAPPSAELVALVMRLLEPDPRDRLGHADDVAAALARFGARGWDDVQTPKPQAYLYRPPLAGRDSLVRKIEAALDGLVSGHGEVLLIKGESGSGKTRLALEAARLAVRRGLNVVAGECVPMAPSTADLSHAQLRAAPLHAFRTFLLAVADHCRTLGESETDRLLAPDGRVLAIYEPTLGQLAGMDRFPPPLVLSGQAARNHVLQQLTRTLIAFAVDKPLVAIIDDIQWCDELSRAAIAHLASRGLAGCGVLVITTCRDDETGATAVEGAQVIEVPPLGPDTVRTIASGMLALREPPPELVDALASQTRGNPFFVTEYLRTAIAAGVLQRSAEGVWQYDDRPPSSRWTPLPSARSIKELVTRRLLNLPAEARALLDAASVLGREVDGAILHETVELSENAALDALDELRLRCILEESESGHLRFAHDALREQVYAQVSAEGRRLLHERAACAMASRIAGGDAHGRLLPAVAHHYSAADKHHDAIAALMRAGEAAKSAYAINEATTFYRSASAHYERLDAEARDANRHVARRLDEQIGDLLALSGEQAEACSAFERAFERARSSEAGCSPLELSKLWHKIGKTWETRHAHARALESYRSAEEALGLAPSEEAGPGPTEGHQLAALDDAPPDIAQAWIQLQVDRVWVYYWLANVDAMDALVSAVRPVIERHGSDVQRARFYQSLTNMNLRRERYAVSEATVAHARASMAAAARSRELVEVALAQFVLGFQLIFHGALDEGEMTMTAAASAAERLGDRPLQSRCLTYLTFVHRFRGATEQTERTAQAALELAQRSRMFDYVGAANANLGWVAWRRGRAAQAIELLDLAFEAWTALPAAYPYPFQWTGLLPRMALLGAEGRSAEALRLVPTLLDKKQHRLPPAVLLRIEQATGEGTPPGNSREALENVLLECSRHGFL